jgi:hypothetical protein
VFYVHYQVDAVIYEEQIDTIGMMSISYFENCFTFAACRLTPEHDGLTLNGVNASPAGGGYSPPVLFQRLANLVHIVSLYSFVRINQDHFFN